MLGVQRHFGKYMKRTADEKTVSVLLKDFEEADQLLSKVCCYLTTHSYPRRDIPADQCADTQPCRS